MEHLQAMDISGPLGSQRWMCVSTIGKSGIMLLLMVYTCRPAAIESGGETAGAMLVY